MEIFPHSRDLRDPLKTIKWHQNRALGQGSKLQKKSACPGDK